MKTFIWRSYGDINVYLVDTLEQIREIYNEVEYEMNQMFAGEFDYEVLKLKENSPYYDDYKNAIESMIFFTSMEIERFEYGTGFYTPENEKKR